MAKKKRTWPQMLWRLFLMIALLGLFLYAGYLVLKYFGIDDLTVEELRDKVSKFGIWGALIFILVSFLQVTFVPIPSSVTILAGNLLFGPFLSFLYSFIGIFIGSLVAFFLGRSIGRRFVNWVVGDKETVEKYLEKARGKEFVVFFFMFLLPMFPDDALCAVAGITVLSTSQFVLIQCIARPVAILGTLFFMSGEIIPYHGWGLVVLALIAILSIVAFIICYKKADQINDFLNRFFDKVSKVFKKNKSALEVSENKDNSLDEALDSKVKSEVEVKDFQDSLKKKNE